ncbi:hypothetical protein B0H17DRAFT_1077577 [Mycena rosella]|uniref:Uncharacterized protein n=1 Tax=Mycena rosella TaxID=1033263 RepID=A0AAD7GDJ6_MYCRO|nr:hypothetical protein B0H17DRAFT_1077577 [Mycena rosella]
MILSPFPRILKRRRLQAKSPGPQHVNVVKHTPPLFQSPANTFNPFKPSVATSPNPQDPQRPQIPKILNPLCFRVSDCNAALSPVSSFLSRCLCPFRHSLLLSSCRTLCELYLFFTSFGLRAILYSACCSILWKS